MVLCLHTRILIRLMQSLKLRFPAIELGGKLETAVDVGFLISFGLMIMIILVLVIAASKS